MAPAQGQPRGGWVNSGEESGPPSSPQPHLNSRELNFLAWLVFAYGWPGANLPYLSLTTPSSLLADEPLGPIAKYHRLRRLLLKLSKANLIQLFKVDGLLWAVPTTRAFDLIVQVQNSNSAKPKPKNPYAWPSRAKPERIAAVKLLDTPGRVMLDEDARDQIDELFGQYLNATRKTRIVLKALTCEAPEDILVLPYKTRFSDPGRRKAIWARYHRAWHVASAKYKKAVFLTLTTSPRQFSTLWRANRHFSIAWNRFMSYLTKRLGKRPHYIAVYEFTESGLLHVHAVIFGVSWLAPKHEITKEWQRCGQGTINYVYTLRNNNGKWVWARKKPKGGGKDAKSYLAKYLGKAIGPTDSEPDLGSFPPTWCLYWAFNKRFFTCSRAFLASRTPPKLPPLYFFLGVIYVSDDAELDEQISQLLEKLYRHAPWWAAVDRGPPFV